MKSIIKPTLLVIAGLTAGCNTLNTFGSPLPFGGNFEKTYSWQAHGKQAKRLANEITQAEKASPVNQTLLDSLVKTFKQHLVKAVVPPKITWKGPVTEKDTLMDTPEYQGCYTKVTIPELTLKYPPLTKEQLNRLMGNSHDGRYEDLINKAFREFGGFGKNALPPAEKRKENVSFFYSNNGKGCKNQHSKKARKQPVRNH